MMKEVITIPMSELLTMVGCLGGLLTGFMAGFVWGLASGDRFARKGR